MIEAVAVFGSIFCLIVLTLIRAHTRIVFGNLKNENILLKQKISQLEEKVKQPDLVSILSEKEVQYLEELLMKEAASKVRYWLLRRLNKDYRES